MNQLFNIIAGGIVQQIRCQITLSKIGIGFISNFSVESSSFIFNNFKTEKDKLTFKGWNRPVGFTRVSFCQNLWLYTLGHESWRRWCRVSVSVVYSTCASFKNSSPRKKVGKLSSFWDWCAESLFVSIIVQKYNILPLANNGSSRKKI